MKEIQAPKVAAMKCTLVNQIEPVNFDWLPENQYLLDWSEELLDFRGLEFFEFFSH